ncbi:XdhC family protein [Halanaerobium salsuginis]|jgi:xanthine dehydrogenase accessory factor|uniref:Xanthine dehydrogenase accessory factor n=1 Tax=Halanaerobium salsuginis TaxID=29563 RepID=A0A1I4IXL7_9FIRM|nr:XdhC family protein [Halanaerobium salsuginis]SFL58516.1 xanthine dehydrogenase accessory factor [Halanaerobium salsuginis]
MGKSFEDFGQGFKDSNQILAAVLTDIENEQIVGSLFGEMLFYDQQGMTNFSSQKMEAEITKFLASERNDQNKNQLVPLLTKANLVVFGAGRLASPLAQLARVLKTKITLVDDQVSKLNYNNLINAEQLLLVSYSDYFSDLKITFDDYLIIISRGQQYDYQILKNVIVSEASYIALIGRNDKLAALQKQLNFQGNTEMKLERLHFIADFSLAGKTLLEKAAVILADIITNFRK